MRSNAASKPADYTQYVFSSPRDISVLLHTEFNPSFSVFESENVNSVGTVQP